MTTFDTHSTFGFSNVASVVSQNSTTLVVNVVTGQGALFAVNQQCVICPPGQAPIITNAMICRLTGIDGDQLTFDVTSGSREGSNVITVQPNFQVANAITPKALTDIENAIGGAGPVWTKTHVDYTDLINVAESDQAIIDFFTLPANTVVTAILVNVTTPFNDGNGDLVKIEWIMDIGQVYTLFYNPGTGSLDPDPGGRIDVNPFAGIPGTFVFWNPSCGVSRTPALYNLLGGRSFADSDTDSIWYQSGGSAFAYNNNTPTDLIMQITTDPGNDSGYPIANLITGAMDILICTQQLPS